MEYPYKFEEYNGPDTRYDCPNCGKPKEFTRYINTTTNQHIDPSVGICNRKDSCGYHKTPKQYYAENKAAGITSHGNYRAKRRRNLNGSSKQKAKSVYYASTNQLKNSLKDYDQNRFVMFLNSLFGPETTTRLIEKYYFGTSKKWPGATVFWQVDIQGKIRTGKIMHYNPITGGRIKEPYDHVAWIHTGSKKPGEVLKQCLFGEHLLKDNNKPVAIVEAEKTAIVGSIYQPDTIWLAAGSKDGLTEEKCQILKGREVVLYPDLKGYNDWLDRATELSNITWFRVSDYLETIATPEEKEQGLDIADYLIRDIIQRANNSEKPVPDLLSSLVDECSAMSIKFSSGEITLAEYTTYSNQLSGRLSEAKIPLQEFIALTNDL